MDLVTTGTVLSQMDAITDDYFWIEDGKAADNYFQTSFLLEHLLKKKKGVFLSPSGGREIRVPFRYDGNETGFYSRGDTVSSDQRTAITAVFFPWAHVFGNGTVLRIDENENSGQEGRVKIVTEELMGAQLSTADTLADSLYDSGEGYSSARLTGLRNLVGASNATGTAASDQDQHYGNLSQNDVVANDGTEPWAGKLDYTSEALTLDIIRDTKSLAEYGAGKQEEPDLIATTKTLYNKTKSILQIQQMFTTEGSKPVKAGFTGLHFEGSDIFPDKKCPSGWMFCLNTNHIGFAVHTKGNFVRTPWSFIEGTAQDKTMKILWDGNMVSNNRRAHSGHSRLS